MSKIAIAGALALCALALESSGCLARDGRECLDSVAVRDTLVGDGPVCEVADSVAAARRCNPHRFRPMQLIVPGTLVGIGAVGVGCDWMRYQNREVRDELQEHVRRRFPIDDYTQYLPVAATYGLRLCGVKGRHGYGGLTVLVGTAYALMGATVYTTKKCTHVERPDGSAHNSFPSGHTATAFMGAELLRREYWDVSPWIGVAGYAVAAGTGFFRMYNNRHWLTDVAAGAGIGILSAQAAWWLYPAMSRAFLRHRHLRDAQVSPYVSQDSKGLVVVVTF